MSLFSERLKTLRKQRGFHNQKLFAEALGVSQQSISLYERGGREPLPPILIKMARLLDTTVDYLIGNTDDPEPPTRLGELERELLELIRQRGGAITFEEVANFWLDHLPKEE